jgi:hypothetical protein
MVKDGSKLLYSGLVTSGDNNPQQAAIFLSPAVLPYFNQSPEMGMDGTFKSKPSQPKGIKQIIVITIFLFNRVSSKVISQTFYKNKSFFLLNCRLSS